MKTFDKVIATSKAVLGLTLLVTVVLMIGYANAQTIYSSPTWDRQDQTMGQQRANQAMEQRSQPGWGTPQELRNQPSVDMMGGFYEQQMLQEQRSQSRSLYNMELQNTKPNACGLDPTYRYARPGC